MKQLLGNTLAGVVALAALVGACGGATESTPASSSGSSGTSGSSGSSSSGSSGVASDAGTTDACSPATGCPLPPDLVCPTPAAPQLSGTASPVDRACVVDDDCASVIFQSDCCGNTFAFGVSRASVGAATAAAATCRSGFPGCGCPQGPTVAETGTPDSGGFDELIDPYCASGTCKTRYR